MNKSHRVFKRWGSHLVSKPQISVWIFVRGWERWRGKRMISSLPRLPCASSVTMKDERKTSIYIYYIYIYVCVCVCVCVLWKNNTFSLTPSKCCFFCTFVNIAIRRLKTTATSFYWSPALAFTSGVLQLWEFPNVRVEIFWLTRVLEKFLGSIYNKIKSIYRQVCW